MTDVGPKTDRLIKSINRTSIDKEIKSYLKLGHEAYVNLANNYGIKTSKSRSYFLINEEERLPMKLIGRMAQTRSGLDKYNPNSGTFSLALKHLGYEIEHNPTSFHTSDFPFLAGKEYSRQTDIHEIYGGQERGGISTPADCPYIFLFTGKSGQEYGYEDGWQENGLFLYTGEGQVGDMRMTAGNKAILEHAKNRKEILLFEILGKGKPVKFLSKFTCQSWDQQKSNDRDGNERTTIRFHLIEEKQTTELLSEQINAELLNEPLVDLRKKAIASFETPAKEGWKKASVKFHKRCEFVKAYVLKRANGTCELSGKIAPFTKKNGTPYLEVHHTKRVADNGPDHPRWVAAIDPTLHREIHFGENGEKLNNQLIKLLGDIEKE